MNPSDEVSIPMSSLGKENLLDATTTKSSKSLGHKLKKLTTKVGLKSQSTTLGTLGGGEMRLQRVSTTASLQHPHYEKLQYHAFDDSNFSQLADFTEESTQRQPVTEVLSSPSDSDDEEEEAPEDVIQAPPEEVPEGHKFVPVTLTYSFTDATFGIEDKTLLHPCSGVFKSGELVAIMGPSGCGKSTLLTMLAGKKTMEYGGKYFLNGQPRNLDNLRTISSFVPQADMLRPTLTVRETFYYYILLKTELSTVESINKRVEWLLLNLNLEVCADSMIGDENIRGISGGQKRRVSIGKSLIASPKMIFLDEPTSGLSSTDALTLVECLRKIANDAGTLIVAVIHQPRFSVFAEFDRLYLLASGGFTAYSGSTADAVGYFAKMGFTVPPNENFADIVLDIVSRGSFPDEQIDIILDSYTKNLEPLVIRDVESHMASIEHKDERDGKKGENSSVIYAKSFPEQLKILIKMYFLLHFRDWQTSLRRLITYTIAGVLVGLIFLNGSYFIAGEALRFIAAIFTALLLVIVLTLDRLPKLIEDRAFYKADKADGIYGTLSFFISMTLPFLLESIVLVFIFGTIQYWLILYTSKATVWLFIILYMELVYLCADSLMLLLSGACDTAATANGLTVSVIAIFVLFGGFLVNTGTSYPWLYWICYLSYYFYAWQACITMIFEYAYLPQGEDQFFKTAEEVYSTFGIHTSLVWWSCLIVTAWALVFRVSAVVCYKYLWNPVL